MGTVVANPFSSKLDLSGHSSQWPRFLYLMYQGLYGVDGFTNISLSLQINRVSFVIASTNGTLPSDIKVLASRDQNIKDIGIENGVVYILSSSYPLDENFSLAFGGKVFSTQSARFTSPLTQVQELVNLSLISVSVRSNGVGIVNATVNVVANSLDNASVVQRTDIAGNLQFYVPPGKYTVTVSAGNNVSASQFTLIGGSSQEDAVNFPGSNQVNYSLYLLWALGALTIIGIGGNTWFWLKRRRIRNRFSR